MLEYNEGTSTSFDQQTAGESACFIKLIEEAAALRDRLETVEQTLYNILQQREQ